MTERVDCVVIGAGVVGMSIARELARRGRETLVLEAEAEIGTGTSARNSEVIHAGLYYPPGSAKARLCVEGRSRLYEYCASRGVEFRRCGKLVVATRLEQTPALQALQKNAQACGVADLQWLSGEQARELEPAVRCCAALLSPSTGIIDSHALMGALRADLEQAGGMVALGARVAAARVERDGLRLQVEGRSRLELLASLVINCAGLGAQEVARSIAGLRADTIPARFLAKGSYYALRSRAPFQHLIYPLPEPGGLGVHLTLDLAGRARFGPDVEWVQQVDYAVDPGRATRFYEVIRRYWPDLPDDALLPAYAGLRPRLYGPGEPVTDFLIQDATRHGVRGLVNLYGIESPGLTACLAMAEDVGARVCG